MYPRRIHITALVAVLFLLGLSGLSHAQSQAQNLAQSHQNLSLLIANDLMGRFSVDGSSLVGGDLKGSLWQTNGYESATSVPAIQAVNAESKDPFEEIRSLFAEFELASTEDMVDQPLSRNILYQLTMLSSRLGDLPAKGSLQSEGDHRFVLTGTPLPETGVLILEIDAEQAGLLTNAKLRLDANKAKTVIINVTADRLDIARLRLSGDFESSHQKRRIVWNVPFARAVRLSDLTLNGSLIAPEAAVHLNRVTVYGSVGAHSLSGMGHIRHSAKQGERSAALRLPALQTLR